MSPAEFAVMFEQNPTQAFRLNLTSGESVIVADPRKTVISEIVLFLRSPEDIDALVGKVTMVSIPNIALVEPIDRSQLRPRTRRRR